MTDSEKLDIILTQLAETRKAVKDLADQGIAVDQNMIVMKATLETLEEQSTIQARALVGIGVDLKDLRDHVLEGEDRIGNRVLRLEKANGSHG